MWSTIDDRLKESYVIRTLHPTVKDRAVLFSVVIFNGIGINEGSAEKSESEKKKVMIMQLEE